MADNQLTDSKTTGTVGLPTTPAGVPIPPPEPPPTPVSDTKKAPPSPKSDNKSTGAAPELTAQLVDSLLRQPPSINQSIPPPPASHKAADIKPPPPAPDKSGTKPKKKSFGPAVILISALLLTSIPVIVYFVSREKGRFTDLTSQAYPILYPTPPPSGTCSNTGAAFAGDCALIHCPRGCGGNDKCGVSDPGARQENVKCGNWRSSVNGNECYQVDPVDVDGKYCVVNGQHGVVAINCTDCGSAPPPGDEPEPTEPPAPECKNIHIYNVNGTDITAELRTGLVNVKAGDIITIGVVGTNATKARVRVLPGAFQETTTKNTDGEYIQQFTIPTLTQTTTFSIEAETFNNGVWR